LLYLYHGARKCKGGDDDEGDGSNPRLSLMGGPSYTHSPGVTADQKRKNMETINGARSHQGA
jgi:hypothetical protein